MQGYVFFSEVQFIPEADLKAIDDLWRQHNNNRFDYSVQKRVVASSSSSPPLIVLAAVEANKIASTTGGFKGLIDRSKPLNKRVLESIASDAFAQEFEKVEICGGGRGV
ncbi:hypothetical protein M0R45_015033 [Rubus argutus]|uniref:GUN4-like domain-containing protein n=1 Tax=Rubus argutus TaxID=59490 RepID=A0AAW1XPB3_RUBAR